MTKTLIAALSVGLIATSSASAQDHAGIMHDEEQHVHDHVGEEATPTDAPLFAATRTLTVRVNGMVCDFCARSLTKVLERKDSVEEVAVSLEDKTVTILLAEDAEMSDAEVEKAVTSAGYTLASIERS